MSVEPIVMTPHGARICARLLKNYLNWDLKTTTTNSWKTEMLLFLTLQSQQEKFIDPHNELRWGYFLAGLAEYYPDIKTLCLDGIENPDWAKDEGSYLRLCDNLKLLHDIAKDLSNTSEVELHYFNHNDNEYMLIIPA